MPAEAGREAPAPPVHGIEVDAQGRCAHWASPLDVVAIRLPCCGRWYACRACHDVLEDHEGRPWPRDEFHRTAVLCGACAGELAIADYLADPSRCPRCGAGFNPRCVGHHPLYFETGAPPPA